MTNLVFEGWDLLGNAGLFHRKIIPVFIADPSLITYGVIQVGMKREFDHSVYVGSIGSSHHFFDMHNTVDYICSEIKMFITSSNLWRTKKDFGKIIT